MIMSYWTWQEAHPSQNALEPVTHFNEAEKKKPAPAPKEKKIKEDGSVAGYVCLIHKTDAQ